MFIQYCDTKHTAASGINACGQDIVLFEPAGETAVSNIIVRNCTVDAANDAQTSVNGTSQGEAITIHNATDFLVHDNVVTDNYKEGINAVHGCQNGNIYRNFVRDFHEENGYLVFHKGSGIYVEANDGTGANMTSNIKVTDNVIFDQSNGITIASEGGGDIDGVKIHNNLVYNVKFYNFYLNGDAGENGGVWGNRKNVKVFNNTFVGDVAGPIARVLEPNATKIAGFEFKNNILYRAVFVDGPNGAMISPGVTSTTYYSHNLYYNGGEALIGALGTPKVVANPAFQWKTFSGWPYSTLYYVPASSPAVEAGVNLSGVGVTNDISGKFRPDGTTHDIGAFEWPH